MKIFIEKQKFTQLWLHILVIINFIISIVVVGKKYVESNGDTNDALIGLIVVFGSFVLVYGLIFSLKLKTRIDELGVHFQFVPFHFSNRTINWDEIEEVYIRKYDAISEYGGWGVKGGAIWRKSKGVAYNVKGDVGLQLELKNGKKILLGTQKESEINRVLETYINKMLSYES